MLRARETKVTKMQKWYGRLWEATTVKPGLVFYPHPQKLISTEKSMRKKVTFADMIKM